MKNILLIVILFFKNITNWVKKYLPRITGILSFPLMLYLMLFTDLISKILLCITLFIGSYRIGTYFGKLILENKFSRKQKNNSDFSDEKEIKVIGGSVWLKGPHKHNEEEE